jgi:glutathione S-transferase
MRARLAIFKSHQQVALRDVVLTNKPKEMILASPKATVPILVLEEIITANGENGAGTKTKVLDESLDIMLWALKTSDPNNLLLRDNSGIQELNCDNYLENKLSEMLTLITEFDVEFKVRLEAYKCAKRYHETTLIDCRKACEHYIKLLDVRLSEHDYLMSGQESLADIALLPFIRQFARIERQWYLQSPYPNLKKWLNHYLQSPMFTKVMAKHPLWLDSGEEVMFGVS